MKKAAIMFLALGFVTSMLFAKDELVVKPTLTSVKVFLRGAELVQNAKVKLEKGMNEVILTGIASNVDRNSINVSGKGDGIIISVVQRFDYLRGPEKNPDVKALEEKLEELNKNLAYKNNDMEVYRLQVDLLLANKVIGNEKIGVSTIELQKMLDLYNKKLTEYKSKIVDTGIEAKLIQKEIEKINKQLAELNRQLNKPTNEIAVSISSKSEGMFSLDLSYLIYDAGWAPNYNIRVENMNTPAQLNYIANVWQNSGSNWDDVQIVLSTRNPNKNNTKPELGPWFLNFQAPVVQWQRSDGLMKSAKAVNYAAEAAAPQQTEMAAGSMADYMETVQTQLAVEFTPTIKYSIPSDSKPHTVALKDYTIKTNYEYYAVPKYEGNAFLIASLSDWSEYNLLPGEVNIYFENSYVGKTYINPETTKDTLQISLGRDEGISVLREEIKDFTEDKFLSSDIERTFAYEIKIKNNKKSSVKMKIEDQIPLSQNEDIEVKLIEFSGAKYNAQDGKLIWNINIEGGKSTTKKLVFSVRHPKDKQVEGL